MELLFFLVLALAVIVIPGPNVLVVVATSIAQGRTRGLQTVAGTSMAMIVQLLIAAFGTAWFVSALSSGFLWLKWIGVAYLLYLGLASLLQSRKARLPADSAMGSFQRGFLVSLTNPKTILFFSAFLPQFVNPSESYLLQIALLSAIFWVLAVMLDSLYALSASRLTGLLKTSGGVRIVQRLGGLVYIGAGSLLALSRQQ